jgi:hypothetical protein
LTLETADHSLTLLARFYALIEHCHIKKSKRAIADVKTPQFLQYENEIKRGDGWLLDSAIAMYRSTIFLIQCFFTIHASNYHTGHGLVLVLVGLFLFAFVSSLDVFLQSHLFGISTCQ